MGLAAALFRQFAEKPRFGKRSIPVTSLIAPEHNRPHNREQENREKLFGVAGVSVGYFPQDG